MNNCPRCERPIAEHVGMEDLPDNIQGLIVSILRGEGQLFNPRLAFVVDETGHAKFASSMPPADTIAHLQQLIERIKRYGNQYVSAHFDRSYSSGLN